MYSGTFRGNLRVETPKIDRRETDLSTRERNNKSRVKFILEEFLRREPGGQSSSIGQRETV